MRVFSVAVIVSLIVVEIGYAATARATEEVRAPALRNYNVVWRSPSKDSSGSMPLGNGDVGLNVWAEEDGGLLFYIGKTDAWSENGRLLKLGRVRLKLEPNPFASRLPFVQTLELADGEIEIRAGKPESAVDLRLWIDANHPVIHLEGGAKRPLRVEVTLEVWRKKDRTLQGWELHSGYGLHREMPGVGIVSGPIPVVVHPDTILPAKDNRIVWLHRNRTSIWPVTMKLQGLDGFISRSPDPLLDRTFGGVIEGKGLVSKHATTLVSVQSRERFSASIYVLTRQTPTVQDWVEEIDHEIRQTKAVGAEPAWQAHLKWWEAFWQRSWIRVSGPQQARTVTEGYILQRFINACGGRGAYPIKFNGSIFTVDATEHGRRYDADYRRWGGPYWFQNTRLIYWPMLATGDFDLMQPLFAMYRHDLPLAKYRTRFYFGHQGAFFPETMYFWGAYASSDYGWDRQGTPASSVRNTYIRYYWQGGLELTAMMLDYYADTQDKTFANRTLLPIAEAVIEFYAQHYPRGQDKKLVFKPAQSLETWQDAVNPLPDIAGLLYDLPRLIDLPSDLVTEQQRAAWKELLKEVPPLPIEEKQGQKVLVAAQEILGPPKNSENPELYAVFPYPLFELGKPDLETARLTFEQRNIKGTGCWRQDAVQAAFLGLTKVARRDVVQNFSTHDSNSRFSAFWFGIPKENWTPDWIPDEDHGGVSMMALESMLMQPEGNKILLFPAWPKAWDVSFKLHAPENTTIECVYRNGRVERLEVRPASRQADVTVCGSEKAAPGR